MSEAPDPGSWSSVKGINSKGDLTGWYGRRGTYSGYVINDGRVTVLEGPGSTFTIPEAINARGDVVGWYTDSAFVSHGFFWDGEVVRPIDIPGASGTNCVGINSRGDIVGVFWDAEGAQHGFEIYK